MEKSRARIAELVIADDPSAAGAAVADVVADSAAAAGHVFAGRAVVSNDGAGIRAALQTWIADPGIDVAVVTSAGTVSEVLSVCADLGTAREISASTQPTDVHLVECGTTLVFVVPGSPSAVADAMDEVVAPHLAASAKSASSDETSVTEPAGAYGASPDAESPILSIQPVSGVGAPAPIESVRGAEGAIPPMRGARTQPPPVPGDKRSTTPPLSSHPSTSSGGELREAGSSTGVPEAKLEEQLVSTSEIVAIAEAGVARPTKPPPLPQSPLYVHSTEDLSDPAVPRGKPRRRRAWIAVALLVGAGAVGFGAHGLINPSPPPKAVVSSAIEPTPVDRGAIVDAEPPIPEIVVDVSAPPSPRGKVTAASAPSDRTAPIRRETSTVNKAPAEDCSEETCIVDNYARGCCARYKSASDGIPQSLAKWMVQAGIERVKPRVIACGEGAAAKGTVRVAVTVAADGSVAAADVTESPSTELGSCVAAAMRFGKFAKTSLGGSFVYPFVF